MNMRLLGSSSRQLLYVCAVVVTDPARFASVARRVLAAHFVRMNACASQGWLSKVLFFAAR